MSERRESEYRTSDRRTALLFGVAAFLALVPGAFFGLPFGKYVVGATRVLSGEVPYHDFWTMYAPGSFYLVAGLFAILGRELAAQGVAACALWAGAAATFFLLLRDAGAGRRVALVCAAVLALARWQTGVELSSYEPAFLLVLIAFRAVLGERRFVAGLLFGCAAIFKHDVAGYACAGAIVALLLEHTSPLRIVGGALAVLVPATVLVDLTAGADAWRDLVLFPLTDFPSVRSEAYPHFLPRFEPLAAWLAHPAGLGEARAAALALARWIQCVLPEIVFLAGCAVALRRRIRSGEPRAESARAARLALAGLPFFWLAAHVQQNTHLHTMAALSMILFALAWTANARSPFTLGVRARPTAVLVAVGSIYAVGLLCVPAVEAATLVRDLPGARTLDLPGTSFVLVPADEARTARALATTVRTLVPEDEPIYVGLERHDATVISSPIVYFLCRRRPAVRHHELHPGVTDRDDVQREMLARITTAGVRCVVLWRFGWSSERLDAIRERNRAAVAGAGSDRLDRFVAESFEPVAACGEYHILRTRDGARPAVPVPPSPR